MNQKNPIDIKIIPVTLMTKNLIPDKLPINIFLNKRNKLMMYLFFQDQFNVKKLQL